MHNYYALLSVLLEYYCIVEYTLSIFSYNIINVYVELFIIRENIILYEYNIVWMYTVKLFFGNVDIDFEKEDLKV